MAGACKGECVGGRPVDEPLTFDEMPHLWGATAI